MKQSAQHPLGIAFVNGVVSLGKVLSTGKRRRASHWSQFAREDGTVEDDEFSGVEGLPAWAGGRLGAALIAGTASAQETGELIGFIDVTCLEIFEPFIPGRRLGCAIFPEIIGSKFPGIHGPIPSARAPIEEDVIG